MDLIFVGGLHWHPECRRAYQLALRSLIDERMAPAFIAIEWDSGVVESRIAQRTLYREKWGAKRPQDRGSQLRKLATRLAWESDGHRAVVRGVPIVWLDEGRVELASSRPFGSNRLVNEQFILGPNFQHVTRGDAMAAINKSWIDEADATQKKIGSPRDSSRDLVWQRRILRAIRVHRGDWAAIVVGAIHASEWDAQTLFCLMSGQYTCVVRFLVWEPTIPGAPCS